MTPAVHPDAEYVDAAEDTFRAVLLSTLDRIATALERQADEEERRTLCIHAGRVALADIADPLAPQELAPIPGAVVPFAPGPVPQAAFVPPPPASVNAPGWVCPAHGQVKTVPAGVSKKTGQPYHAFLACPVAGCNQKPPR